MNDLRIEIIAKKYRQSIYVRGHVPYDNNNNKIFTQNSYATYMHCY